jgi:integrase
MPYAEKRDGKLTGRYISELRTRGLPKRAFASKKDADGYEAYVKATGEEPAWVIHGGDPSDNARTFKVVAQELKDAGGPGGVWKRGRDRSVIERLDFVCGLPFGSLAIDKVTYARAEELVKSLAKRPGQREGSTLSDGTINRYLTAVSSVLTYAELKEYIDASPKLPWRKEFKKKKATYSETQERAVIDALRAAGHETDAFLVSVLIISGMRVGELLGLRADQIEDGFVSLDDPEDIKNQEVRECYIGEENEARLRALVRENALPTYQQFRTHLKAALKKCGYEIPRAVHALRHTTATRTVAAEGDIQMAKELLGHRNLQTTLDYRHISKEVRRERAKKLHPQRGSEPEVSVVLPLRNQAK